MGKYNLDPSKLGSLDLTPNQLGAQAYRRSGSFIDWAPAGSIAEAMTSVPQWSNLVTNFATQPMLSDVDIGAGMESARIGGLEGSRDAYSAWQEGIDQQRRESMWPTDKLSDLVGLGVAGLQSIPSLLTPESTMQALPEDRRILEQYQKDYALPLETAQQPSAIPGLSRGEAKGLFESGFQALPSAAMAVLTRRMPMGARLPATLAPFAAPVWAQSYEKAVTEGATPLEASKQAKLHTIFEVGPELIPFGIFLKQGWPIVTKILASIPAEYISEALTEVGYIGEEFYKGDLSWEDPNIGSILLERINKAGKLGAYMGPMMGTSIAGAEAVAQQTADVVSPRATEADMLAELERQTAPLPGQQIITPDLPGYIEALEAQDSVDPTLLTTLEQARAEQAAREAGLTHGTTFSGMNIGDTAVFNLEDIYNVVSEDGTKRPSKRAVKQHVEDLVFEEVVFHGGVRNFAIANQDKLDEQELKTLQDFYTAYRKRNEVAFQAWVNNPANSLYTREVEQEEEFAQDHMRGLQKQRFRNIFRRIANKIVGAENTIFGLRERDVINLLDKVQESIKTRKETESAALVEKLSAAASKKGFDPSRRRFLKQVGGAAAGIAADPRMILEPATPIAPPTQGLTDVVVPDIDTIYKFDIAVDPNAGWTSSDDPSEGSMEVTFNYEANQELIEVYEGDELVDTINIAENQEDVDSLIVQYVNDEYGSRNVNSVHDPIRDPEGEGGDDGGPLTESEMDAFFNDADTSYKQQAQNMVAGELARKIEPGQRESFAQMVEEGTVRIPERSSAYDYFDEPTTPRLPEPTTLRLPEPTTPRIDIDRRRETAIEKATAPNLHIRNSDLRMNAIKEDWENNKNDLDFRRDYANFGVYEQVEWDLNYDMWIDEFKEAEQEVKSLPAPETRAAKQLTTQDRVNLEEGGEADALTLSIDNIYSTFDEDYTVADAIENGTLDQLVRMEAQNSNFTRQELWDAVNARQEALESIDIESARRVDARAAKRRVDMSAAEILNRDVRNEATKKYRKAINNSEISDDDKVERRKLLKNLLRPWGAEGIKRNLTPGDRDTFRQYAQMIVDGELDAVREFIQPFLDQIAAQKAPSKTKTAKRKYYAGYKGVSASELAAYRERGKTHPMEKKMTYPFADEEIDRLEAGGEITVEEAENRRSVARELRSALQGRLPQTVKRKLTEIVYGIEDYADITPWTDKYTATEIEGMGERAEVAQAEARRIRYEKTKLTSAQKSKILDYPITAEERTVIGVMEGDLSFENLTTPRERLLFLREPTAMSVAERAELDAFLADIQGFDQKQYKAEQAEKMEKVVATVEVKRIPAVDITKLRKEVAQMWKEESRFKQMDPTVMERSIEDTSIDALDAESLDVATITGESVGRAGKRRQASEHFARLLMNASWSERENIKSIKRAHDEIELWLEEYEGKEMPAIDYKRLENLINRYEDGLDQVVRVERGALGARFRENIKKMLGRQAPKIAAWKRFLDENNITYTKTGHSTSFLKKTEEEKKDLLLKWFAFEDGNWGELPDTLKRPIYQSMPDTFGKWDNTLVRTFNTKGRMRLQQLKYLTGVDWSIEHKAEFSDPIIQRDLIPYLRGELNNTESAALMVLLNDLSNLSLMPAFLNSFKNNITNQAQITILNDWFEILDEKLEGSTDFMQSHQDALKAFIEKYKDSALIKVPELNPQQDKVDENVIEFINTEYGELETLAYQNALRSGDIAVYKQLAETLAWQLKEQNAIAMRASKKASGTSKDYSEHFSDQFWYRFTSYLWGKPVQAIRNFNKFGQFNTEQGNIEAADKIADLIQRAHSWQTRAKGEVLGPDLVQDISMRSGEFYSELFKVFAKVTNIVGAINATNNKQLVDALMGKESRIKDPKVEAAAKELRSLIEKVYNYAKNETKGLATLTEESPLDLRGHGDTLLPRVWNIEYLATREGKAKLLKALSEAFSPPGKTTPVFEDSGITVEDMYNVIINSGGFVQGEWTNLKADQTRTEKDIELDLKVQEYLDSLETENLMEEGLVLEDLQAVIPRFIQKAIERTEYAKRFGKNDKRLRALIKEGIDQIREHNKKVYKMKKGEERLPHIDEKRFERAVWDMARILRNKYGYDLANMSTRVWLQRAQNIEVVAKLPLVTLASMPEFFTPMLRGDVSPHHWFMDLMAGMAWAGYKGLNGISKLLLNKHLPAMLKKSKDIEGLGIISDVQLLRELGIADIQAMGDLVSTRYANPNFARGGLRAGATGTIAGKIPKNIRAVFNMQTYMQATMLTTMTEMQQLMALRHFQRFASKRVKYLKETKGKKLSTRQKRLITQYRRDLLDFGITESIDLETPSGEAAFNVGALRFVDQVITRPNDATTAKAFKNPLLAPLVLFKRFITTYSNTLLVAVGNDFAHSPSNIEKAKTVGQTLAVASMMYGAVMFAEIIRAALKGDLDEDDLKPLPDDFRVFMRRLDRTGLLTAPGTLGINLAFPYKRGWWDTAEARITGEVLGPIGGDAFALGDALIENKKKTWERLLKQFIPTAKIINNIDLNFDFLEGNAKEKSFSDRSW